MPNTINTQTNVIQKALATAVAVQDSTFRDNASKAYQGAYEEKINGYKIGDTFEIAKPAIYDAIDGMVDGTDVTALDAEFIEEKFSVTVNSNPLLAPSFTDKELTFELDRKSKEGLARLTAPVGEALNEKSEGNGASIYTREADATIVVDAAPANFKDIFGNAKIALIEAGAKGDIISIIDERMMITLSRELEEKFNPVKKVEDAFDGEFYSYNKINFTPTLRLDTHVNGAGGTSLTLGADYVEGATTIQVSAIGNTVVGDMIDLGVKQVNQRSKDKLVFNATRVVKAINGNVITITPIYFTGHQLQNVDVAGLATSDTVSVLGTAGESYKVYPIYAKKAWGYVNIEQPALDAVDEVKVKPIKGVNCRYYSWTDGNKANVKQRAETLEAWFAIRSEFMSSVQVKVGLV